MRRSTKTADVYQALPGFEPSVRFQLTGRSMEPCLLLGQTVECRTPRSLTPGNCYLFRFGDRMLIHRLVKAKNGTAFFMGDNSGSIEPVSCGDIVAEIEDRASQLYKLITVIINRLFLMTADFLPFFLRGFFLRIRLKGLKIIFAITSYFIKIRNNYFR